MKFKPVGVGVKSNGSSLQKIEIWENSIFNAINISSKDEHNYAHGS